MQVDESRGTFEDVIHNSAPAAAEIALSLRRLIQELCQDVTEVHRPAEQHTDYVINAGKKESVFTYICPVKGYVRLGFYYGAALPDPARVLVGNGKRLRHIKLNEVSDVQRPEVHALILAACKERKNKLEAMDME